MRRALEPWAAGAPGIEAALAPAAPAAYAAQGAPPAPAEHAAPPAPAEHAAPPAPAEPATPASPGANAEPPAPRGLRELEGAVRALFHGAATTQGQQAVITSERHHALALRAAEAARDARAAIDAGLADEAALVDLREALDALGEITGENTTEDLLERVFENFCVGK
jgi:hypothetical protein